MPERTGGSLSKEIHTPSMLPEKDRYGGSDAHAVASAKKNTTKLNRSIATCILQNKKQDHGIIRPVQHHQFFVLNLTL